MITSKIPVLKNALLVPMIPIDFNTIIPDVFCKKRSDPPRKNRYQTFLLVIKA